MRRNKHTFWLVIVGLLIGWIAYGVSVTRGSTNLSSPSGVLGIRSSSSSFDVNVLAATYYPVDEATQTQRFSLPVLIHNRSSSTIQLSPGLQMSILDSNSGVTYATATYQPAGKIIGGPLKAGETWNDTLDFVIPANSSAQTFIFQLDAATESVKVTL